MLLRMGIWPDRLVVSWQGAQVESDNSVLLVLRVTIHDASTIPPKHNGIQHPHLRMSCEQPIATVWFSGGPPELFVCSSTYHPAL